MTSPVLGGRTTLNTVVAVLSGLLGVAALVLTIPYLANGDASDEGNAAWSWLQLVAGVLLLVAAVAYYRKPRDTGANAAVGVLLVILGVLSIWTIVGPIIALVTLVLLVVAYTRRNRVLDR